MPRPPMTLPATAHRHLHSVSFVTYVAQCSARSASGPSGSAVCRWDYVDHMGHQRWERQLIRVLRCRLEPAAVGECDALDDSGQRFVAIEGAPSIASLKAIASAVRRERQPLSGARFGCRDPVALPPGGESPLLVRASRTSTGSASTRHGTPGLTARSSPSQTPSSNTGDRCAMRI